MSDSGSVNEETIKDQQSTEATEPSSKQSLFSSSKKSDSQSPDQSVNHGASPVSESTQYTDTSIEQSTNRPLSQSSTQSTSQSLSQAFSNPSHNEAKVGERRKRTSVHFTMPPPASETLYLPSSAPGNVTPHLSHKQIHSHVWQFFRLVKGVDDFCWCVGCKKYLVYKPQAGISNLRKHIVVKHNGQGSQQSTAHDSDEEDDINYQPSSSRPVPPYSSTHGQAHHQPMYQPVNQYVPPPVMHQGDPSAASWTPESVPPQATALLVLDYQKDIVMQFLPNYRAYVDRINAVIDVMRRAGATIVFVHTSFNSWPVTKEISQRNMSFVRLQQQKQVRFTGEGADLYAGLNRDPSDIVVKKNRASAFTGSPLSSIIDGNSIRSLVVCGLATSGTVLSTILDAADRDYVCTVLKDACWDPQTIAHETLCALVFPTRGTVCSCDELVARYQQFTQPMQYEHDE